MVPLYWRVSQLTRNKILPQLYIYTVGFNMVYQKETLLLIMVGTDIQIMSTKMSSCNKEAFNFESLFFNFIRDMHFQQPYG